MGVFLVATRILYDSIHTVFHNHNTIALSDRESELLVSEIMVPIGIFTEEDLYTIVGTMEEGGANALDFCGLKMDWSK